MKINLPLIMILSILFCLFSFADLYTTIRGMAVNPNFVESNPHVKSLSDFGKLMIPKMLLPFMFVLVYGTGNFALKKLNEKGNGDRFLKVCGKLFDWIILLSLLFCVVHVLLVIVWNLILAGV